MEPFFSFSFFTYWVYGAIRDWQTMRKRSWTVRLIAIGLYSLSMLLFICYLNDIKVKMPADLLNKWVTPTVQRWLDGG